MKAPVFVPGFPHSLAAAVLKPSCRGGGIGSPTLSVRKCRGKCSNNLIRAKLLLLLPRPSRRQMGVEVRPCLGGENLFIKKNTKPPPTPQPSSARQ